MSENKKPCVNDFRILTPETFVLINNHAESKKELTTEIKNMIIAANTGKHEYNTTVDMINTMLNMKLTQSDIKKKYISNRTYAFIRARNKNSEGHYIIVDNEIMFSNEGFKALCFAINTASSRVILRAMMFLENEYTQLLREAVLKKTNAQAS